MEELKKINRKVAFIPGGTPFWWSGECDYRNDINWKIYISKRNY